MYYFYEYVNKALINVQSFSHTFSCCKADMNHLLRSSTITYWAKRGKEEFVHSYLTNSWQRVRFSQRLWDSHFLSLFRVPHFLFLGALTNIKVLPGCGTVKLSVNKKKKLINIGMYNLYSSSMQVPFILVIIFISIHCNGKQYCFPINLQGIFRNCAPHPRNHPCQINERLRERTPIL